MEITISGLYKSEREAEQLVGEAVWILKKYAKAYRQGDARNIEKYREKWANWSKAHPRESGQIVEQMRTQIVEGIMQGRD